MSPAFSTDEEGRVTSVMNVAITNIPATRNLEPLMAASAVEKLGENGMSVEEFLKVCKALGIDMSSSLEEAMAKIKGEKPAENEEPVVEEPAALADPPAPPAEEKPEEQAAALSQMFTDFGVTSLVALAAKTKVSRAAELTLASERQKLAEREAVLESAERRRLCAELVTKAGKAPAEVWASDKADAPKKYLAAMPIEDFREFVADAVKAHGKSAPVAPPAAAGAVSATGEKEFVTPLGTVKLSAREQAMCVELKQDPTEYASRKLAAKKKD